MQLSAAGEPGSTRLTQTRIPGAPGHTLDMSRRAKTRPMEPLIFSVRDRGCSGRAWTQLFSAEADAAAVALRRISLCCFCILEHARTALRVRQKKREWHKPNQ